jgi:hypothetical protein
MEGLSISMSRYILARAAKKLEGLDLKCGLSADKYIAPTDKLQ